MLRADRHHLSKIIAGIEGNTSQRQYACDGEKPSRAAHNNSIWLQTVVSHEGPLTFYRLQSFGSVLGLPIALTLNWCRRGMWTLQPSSKTKSWQLSIFQTVMVVTIADEYLAFKHISK